jgi:hypothetical protein
LSIEPEELAHLKLFAEEVEFDGAIGQQTRGIEEVFRVSYFWQ